VPPPQQPQQQQPPAAGAAPHIPNGQTAAQPLLTSQAQFLQLAHQAFPGTDTLSQLRASLISSYANTRLNEEQLATGRIVLLETVVYAAMKRTAAWLLEEPYKWPKATTRPVIDAMQGLPCFSLASEMRAPSSTYIRLDVRQLQQMVAGKHGGVGAAAGKAGFKDAGPNASVAAAAAAASVSGGNVQCGPAGAAAMRAAEVLFFRGAYGSGKTAEGRLRHGIVQVC
jgi:hypothetical protein